jgi:lysine biosynthesis protein LysW
LNRVDQYYGLDKFQPTVLVELEQPKCLTGVSDMSVALCPDCEEGINFGSRVRIGQRLSCPHCGADLEVVELSPIELDWAYEDTDWEDEDESDDDWDDDDEDGWDDDDDDEDGDDDNL